MKKTYLSILICCIYINIAFSQAPSWAWINHIGGANMGTNHSIATDPFGNVIVSGTFNLPNMIFGTDTLLNSDFSHKEIYIVKYDASGNIIWAKSAGGSNDDRPFSICCDPSGNIFIGGYFTGSITFDSITLGGTAFSADMFVAKYDFNGNILWARKATGSGDDEVKSIVADNAGNVYATGYFSGSSLSLGSVTLTNSGVSSDIAIIKYDPFGNLIWAKNPSGNKADKAFGITLDNSGNLYITGAFTSIPLNFGSTSISNSVIGYDEIFIAKLDSAGNALWAKSAVGSNHDDGYCVATDRMNNVYIGGYFKSLSITFDTLTLPGYGDRNLFLVKYDSAGNALWGKGLGDYGDEDTYTVATDSHDNVYIGGDYSSNTLTFGSTTFVNTAPPNWDMFLAKYDAAGNSLWAKSATGGNYYESVNSISVDRWDNLYMIATSGSDSVKLDNTIYTHISGADLIVARLDSVQVALSQHDISDPGNVINVFPNPFTSETTVLFGTEQNNSMISIYNLTGEKITEVKFKGRRMTLLQGALSAGMYILEITDDHNQQWNRKIIIY